LTINKIIKKYRLWKSTAPRLKFDQSFGSAWQGSRAMARHSQLNKNFIEPLISWGFISISGRGKSSRIEITQGGENILKFLPK